MDFCRNKDDGQMTPEERQALYELIIKEKLEIIFEVGTWKGGGSTYYISSALEQNKKGILYTSECERDLYSYAIQLYDGEFSHLKSYVNFNLGRSLEIYPKILSSVQKIDLVFLDGWDIPQYTLKEYEMFYPYLKSGSFLACHDWKVMKMSTLKDVIKDDPSWLLHTSLMDGPTGFTIFQKNNI